MENLLFVLVSGGFRIITIYFTMNSLSHKTLRSKVRFFGVLTVKFGVYVPNSGGFGLNSGGFHSNFGVFMFTDVCIGILHSISSRFHCHWDCL